MGYACKLGKGEAKKYITYTFLYPGNATYCFLILDSIASNPRASGTVKYNTSSNSWSDDNVILGSSGVTSLYITCKRPCWYSRSTSQYNQPPYMQAYQYQNANTTVLSGANYNNAVYTTLCFEK